MNTEPISVACSACGRANLPGGVRCIYCGTHYPPALDFDMGTPAATKATVAPVPTVSARGQQGKAAGAVGSLALLLMKAKSLFALFKIGKIALTFSTMLLSILAYAQIYRWRFAVGFVICIFIHELGHVFVNWRKGLKQTAPMFIPFLGAVIFVRQFPNEPTVESESGAGGPAAGALAALACLLIGNATGNPFWYALASIGFVINLFNLAPFGQLDGAHIAAVFSPAVWNGALFAILLVALKTPFYALWLVLGANLLARMSHTASDRYLLAAPLVRVRMAAVYVLLCVGLCWGIQRTGAYIGTERRDRAVQARPAGTPASSLHAGLNATPAASTASAASHPPFSPSPKSKTHAGPGASATQIVYAVLAVCALFACGLWAGMAYLLAAASKTVFTARRLVLPLLLAGLFPLLLIVGKWTHVSAHDELALVGAYYIAAVFAVGYAGYEMSRQGRRQVRPAHIALLARCMAWACGGALLVAYTANSWQTLLAVALLALAVYARCPWMPVSMAAGWAEAMSDHTRAIALLHRAIALKPDAASVSQLWTRIARLNLLNERGGATLAALDARQSALAAQAANTPNASAVTAPSSPSAAASAVSAPSLSDLETRAAALMLVERFNESLACCEQMLVAGPNDRAGALRLLAVHIRLARIAHQRGWDDEAVAQADWCIRVAAKLPRTLMARLQAARAKALAAQGNIAEARAACAQALAASREPYTQAMTGVVEAELCLREGDMEAAEQAASRALRLLPGSLQCRYWQGRALSALNREEGRKILRSLAADFPDEYWGRQAANTLASVPV